ncbi:hypothetical protein R3P38DRAFT_2806113 [Favolaschia claudopus]|uniref:Uncharacterized protein n=1 Tax=Favolaschia claudopus TaxID=2862362 RepID=A0AAV9ZKJ2_9AGAR
MTVQKNIVRTKYVPDGLQTMVSGVLARFRHSDFRQYRHCVNNTSTEHANRSYMADTSVQKEALQVPGVLAIFPGNPLTDSVKEGPETAEFSPRLTPWEGIQPKIVIHHLKPPEFTPRTGIQPNRINIPLESK